VGFGFGFGFFVLYLLWGFQTKRIDTENGAFCLCCFFGWGLDIRRTGNGRIGGKHAVGAAFLDFSQVHLGLRILDGFSVAIAGHFGGGLDLGLEMGLDLFS
jgi:hypothetical protein